MYSFSDNPFDMFATKVIKKQVVHDDLVFNL